MILCFGELVAFWLDYGFAFLTIDSWWRIPLAIQIVPAAILAYGCWVWVPPSPRWLVQQDRLDCAREVLTRMHGSEAAEIEMQDIYRQDQFEKAVTQATWADMFKMPVLRVTLLGMGVQFFQQITGTNSILYYAVSPIIGGNINGETMLTDPITAFPVRKRRHHQPPHCQSSKWRCRSRLVRLRMDPDIRFRSPRPQDLVAAGCHWNVLCHDWYHCLAMAR